jgi:hypothetical protein
MKNEIALEPVQILIEMDVTRYQDFPEDGFVQVWGYVGDYEVGVCLPHKDWRVQKILRQKNQPR